jgi:NAD(P)-dependent dehydrogenase (short-subunit alcohol dehydrogenase family)
MKIVVVGASGAIGKAVVKELAARHEIVPVGRSSGDIRMNITDSATIRAGLQKIGGFDALVSTAGEVHFGPLEKMNAAEFEIGLRDKLMGQVNLVLIGREFANDRASFTLTSGVLGDDPVMYGSSASMVSGALDSFVRAAAIELPRGMRINTVSPGVLQESMDKYAAFFRGHEPVAAARVALAYSKSVEGALTGQVFRVI